MKNNPRILTVRRLTQTILLSCGLLLLAISPARAATTSTLKVPISGTVGTASEQVFLSGQLHIVSTFLPSDPVRPLTLNLYFNLNNVKGVGQVTGARYIANGATQLQLRAQPSDPIRLTFPFFTPVEPITPTDPIRTVNFLVASVTLTFSESTHVLTSATAFFSSPTTE